MKQGLLSIALGLFMGAMASDVCADTTYKSDFSSSDFVTTISTTIDSYVTKGWVTIDELSTKSVKRTP